MDHRHKIIAQLLVKWEDALVAQNIAEVRAIKEEVAYLWRAKKGVKLKEMERIRLRFGLHSAQLEAIEAVNHAAPVSTMSKSEMREHTRLLRFCVHCDAEMQEHSGRFACPNEKCLGRDD